MTEFIDKVKRYAEWNDTESGEAMIRLAQAGMCDIRTLNCAVNNGVRTLSDFTKFTEKELMRWDNFGRKSLNLVKDVLGSNGLALNDGDMGDDLLRGLLQMAAETREALRKAGEDHKAALAAVELRQEQLLGSRKPA